MEKSRICLVTNLYPPDARGGAERVVERIARALKENGCAVSIVTSVSSWPMNFRALMRGGWVMEIVDGISIYRTATLNLFPYWTIGEHTAFVRLFWHLFDLFAVETAFTIRKILEREKPDVVMTHNLKGLGFLVPRAIRRSGIRHIHTVHDVQLVVPSGLLAASGTRGSIMIAPFFRWYEALTRWLVGSPDVVVSPSQWLLDFHTERGFFPQSKKIVLSNPVEIRQNLQPTTYNLQPTIRFLYVGQIEKHKGILFLIDVIKNFQLSTFNFQLDIVGTGSLLSQIQKAAQNDHRITVHGAVPHEQLAQFYANADVLIVPSLVHENTPTVILEAFAHGVPVIASRVGGISECVEEGKTGWLFEAGNADALLSLLQHVVQEKQKFPEMGEAIHASLYGRGVREYADQLLELV